MNIINFMDYCSDLKPVISLLKAAVTLIQWGIPFVLIVFGMLDLGKAVMAGKEDEMKSAQKLLIKRFIYAVAVFLVVTLVMFVMNLVASNTDSDSGAGNWYSCWKKA